jgi:peptide methionine sulfoxide reductase msrA/msrB
MKSSSIVLLVTVLIISLLTVIAVAEEKNVTFNKLTPEEEHVIIYKGTEKPFSGELYDHKEAGTYVCKRCNAQLYKSDDKFDSGCGWPSFDDEIPGAIKRTTDADGVRTEITCAKCSAHLGHVFEGEKLTAKNIRHCVNSISLDFIPSSKDVKTDVAYFAGGCFWGTEYLLQQQPGVISTQTGYMGGNKDNPTYKEVCSGEK